jgi:hypothetical protein
MADTPAEFDRCRFQVARVTVRDNRGSEDQSIVWCSAIFALGKLS